jgi:glutamate-1-semialdehyde 2,1-aminomutase
MEPTTPATAASRIDRDRLARLISAELALYQERGARSAERYKRAQDVLLSGVPMSWMLKWAGAFPIQGDAGAFPIFGASAHGSRLVDVDGNEYIDFCLGDTGAMTGHSPEVLVRGLAAELGDGLTFMLPTDWVIEAAEQLRQRFGLDKWQFTVSATDANRFSIRLARQLTGRPKVLIFNHCYHGTVDEAFASLDSNGQITSRPWNFGPPVPLSETTRVVEFNDVDALERELSAGDVACVITEPALTNVGIVLPEPGFHAALREIATKHGALLILDETHTICAGAGGYSGEHGLEPDILTIGKAIGGGVPAGAWGIRTSVAERVLGNAEHRHALVEGIGVGGTLAGNVLSARAIALTLENLLTPEDFSHMSRLAGEWKAGVERHISALDLPWHVTQLGARAEYHFCSESPQNGTQLAAVGDEHLERFIRLFLTNRGILTTPFHNMALMAPTTTTEDVARHDEVLGEALYQLAG